MDIKNELIAMKEKILKAREDKTRLEGKQEQLMIDLKKLGYNSIEEADEGLKNLEVALEALETGLETKVAEFKQKFQWT